MPFDCALSGSSGVIHQPTMVGSSMLARPTESCPTMAYIPSALMVARSLDAIGSVPALLPTKMLTPSCESSVACHEPWSQTAIGKKEGSVGMPRVQPAYGLAQASCGTGGTHGGVERSAAFPSICPKPASSPPVLLSLVPPSLDEAVEPP